MSDLLRPGARSPHADAPSPPTRLLARVLLVLGVLAGLFAMHGLSADHDLAMAAAHNDAAGAVSERAAAHQPVVAHTAAQADLTAPADVPASDPMADMAQACLAILTGAAACALLLLSPLRAMLSRRLRIGQPLLRPRRRTLLLLRPPDLSVLCVLRT